MKSLEHNTILCRFLYRKLEEIEKGSPIGFSKSERYFIKYLSLLYKSSKEHADYFAEKYKTLINRKASRVVYDVFVGDREDKFI